MAIEYKNILVTFCEESAILTREIATIINKHNACLDIIFTMEPFISSEFTNDTEQLFAMYIITHSYMDISLSNISPTANCLIQSNDVLIAASSLLRVVLSNAFVLVPYQGTILHMLMGYTINLISKICGIDSIYVSIIGECVKKLIITRNYLPDFFPSELYSIIEGRYPLINHPESPLTARELTVIHDYLNSKKNIYVNILLNCLFDMGKQIKLLSKPYLEKDEFIEICNSSWLSLLLGMFW